MKKGKKETVKKRRKDHRNLNLLPIGYWESNGSLISGLVLGKLSDDFTNF